MAAVSWVVCHCSDSHLETLVAAAKSQWTQTWTIGSTARPGSHLTDASSPGVGPRSSPQPNGIRDVSIPASTILGWLLSPP
jgi:hypothetical protein